ncbi:MAG: signal peptidase II [Bacillota bacterium]
MWRFWSAVFVTILADQLSKLLAARFLLDKAVSVPGVLTLHYVGNPGAAFGFFANRTPFLVLVSLVLGAVVLAGYNKIKAAPVYWRWGVGLLFGGALGNLIDRLRFGYVVDFIDFSFWPVFNLADTALVCAVAVIACGVLREK